MGLYHITRLTGLLSVPLLQLGLLWLIRWKIISKEKKISDGMGL
jgi:hypothetical protein